MTIIELYSQTPVDKHSDIKVIGDRVFVKVSDGGIDEYVISSDGELWLVRSDTALRQDIQAIKAKLEI